MKKIAYVGIIAGALAMTANVSFAAENCAGGKHSTVKKVGKKAWSVAKKLNFANGLCIGGCDNATKIHKQGKKYDRSNQINRHGSKKAPAGTAQARQNARFKSQLRAQLGNN